MSQEEDIKKFVESQENSGDTGAPPGPLPEAKVTPVNQGGENQVGSPITPTNSKNLPWQKSDEQIDKANAIGWDKIPIKDLPTQGLFYPEDAEITIRAASSGEIRHWSTLNEDDLSSLDDMLNYIVERCSAIKSNKAQLSWKDIKEVDRFYILLAIRERTFVKGENMLQVKVSETKKIDVVKDMIDYINFDDQLLQRYNPEKRCISLKFKSSKVIDIHLPSVGVTNWLKNYIQRKQQQGQPFDQDFLNFAPFVIPDWRGLNDNTYERFVYESQNWSTAEISVLTKIREIFADTINPVIKYMDEQGGERTIPLNFQGGIKSIFLISDPFSELA
jgi:hypothetical protein